MPLYLESIGGMTYQQIGWLGSVFGICMMATNVPAGWLADKKGERIGIVLGFLLEAMAMGLFVVTQGFWGYALTWALFGVGVGLMSPAYNSLISKAVPEKVPAARLSGCSAPAWAWSRCPRPGSGRRCGSA